MQGQVKGKVDGDLRYDMGKQVHVWYSMLHALIELVWDILMQRKCISRILEGFYISGNSINWAKNDIYITPTSLETGFCTESSYEELSTSREARPITRELELMCLKTCKLQSPYNLKCWHQLCGTSVTIHSPYTLILMIVLTLVHNSFWWIQVS